MDLFDHAAVAASRARHPPGRTSFGVKLPGGFIAVISYELQAAGPAWHLSASFAGQVDAVPTPPVMDALIRAFGLARPLAQSDAVWLEEFAPGHYSVNVVQLEAAGRA